MKRSIILFFSIFSVFSAYSQNYLQEGDRCFDNGNYSCAVEQYSKAYNMASGSKKDNIDLKLMRARRCAEKITIANKAFDNKDYKTAKENYQIVLESNPKDAKAKSQLEICNNKLNPTPPPPPPSSPQPSAPTSSPQPSAPTSSPQPSAPTSASRPSAPLPTSSPQPSAPTSAPRPSAPPPTTLSVSPKEIEFLSNGGSDRITVTTNASSYAINGLPAWCTVQRNTGYFTVTCNVNSGSSTRGGYFTVTAGDKTVRINVSQSGKKQPETTLSVSLDSLMFHSSGGRSEEIDVYSNASTYTVSYVPSWLRIQTYDGYFVVTCTPNNSNRNRTDWFYVVAGGKEVQVKVSQVGVVYTSVPRSDVSTANSYYYPKQRKTNNCFNCPTTNDPLGLTFGYVQKTFDSNYYMGGIQFGLQIEPLIKYGFGFNTGFFLETYFSNNWASSEYDDPVFEQFALYIPVHPEYRLNFSKWFNLFAYCGIGFNVITNSSFVNYAYPITFDYGGGMRINRVQFNVGQSVYSKTSKSEQDLIPYKKLSVSLSIMF